MALIVVADDEPDIAALACRILQRANHSVILVGDGAAALDAVQQHRPQAVLLDVDMPHMSGLTACRKIREDPSSADVPIGVVSGSVLPPYQAVHAAGADAVLPKPFTPQELHAPVDRLLNLDRSM